MPGDTLELMHKTVTTTEWRSERGKHQEGRVVGGID